MCDDENIEPISEDDLANYFGDNITGAGYVLFYQAVDLDLLSLGLRKRPEPKVRPEMPLRLIDEARKVLVPVAEAAPSPVATAPTTPAVATPAYVPSPVAPTTPSVPIVAVPPPAPAAPAAPAVPAAPAAPVAAAAPSSHPSTPSNPSSSGTPNGSVRKEPSTNYLATAFMEHNSPARRRDPSISRTTGDKSNRWSILKRKDEPAHRQPLQRQGTATTLGTLGTDSTSTSSMPIEEQHSNEPLLSNNNGMTSSMMSNLSANSAAASSGTGRSSPPAPPSAMPTNIGRSASSARPDRTPSGMSTSNGYGGGTSLGRKLSDRTGISKLSRTTSSGWKMGFGKKGKVDE